MAASSIPLPGELVRVILLRSDERLAPSRIRCELVPLVSHLAFVCCNVPDLLVDNGGIKIAGWTVHFEVRGNAQELTKIRTPYGRANLMPGSGDALVLRAGYLESPFVAQNEEPLRRRAPRLEHQLKGSLMKLGAGGQVNWVLKRLLSASQPDVSTAPRELGMSDRPLQLRIAKEGTTLRQLLDEARSEPVRQFLADDSIEIAKFAIIMSYDNANSFYRAFRTWECRTPAEWRATLPEAKLNSKLS